jgi:CheY-like chemotaxis protein
MRKILVIDDDDQMRAMMVAMLDRAGFQVLEAADGKQGLRLCEHTAVDLVITDVIMPEMEGLEVIMGLKKKFRDMRIIAISGGARMQPQGYLNLAAKLGADRTFTKPFDRSEFLMAVKELLG